MFRVLVGEMHVLGLVSPGPSSLPCLAATWLRQGPQVGQWPEHLYVASHLIQVPLQRGVVFLVGVRGKQGGSVWCVMTCPNSKGRHIDLAILWEECQCYIIEKWITLRKEILFFVCFYTDSREYEQIGSGQREP